MAVLIESQTMSKSGNGGIILSAENYFAVMSILIGFVCLLLAGFLLAVKSKRAIPNRFLASFLLLTACELMVWLPSNSDEGSWGNAMLLAVGKLQMPVFLGVFLSSCFADFRLAWRDALHLMPFILALAISFSGNQMPFVTASDSAFLTSAELAAHQVASHVLYYGYIVAVFAVLLRFRNLYKTQYASGRSETLLWLTQLACASLFAHTLILVRDGLFATPYEEAALNLQILGAFVALAITTWIALKSLLQPDLFRAIDSRLMRLGSVSSDSHRVGLQRIVRHMKNAEPYLDPDLSLATLATDLSMAPRDLSEILNHTAGRHFFDFVNEYRVEHAKLLLSHPSKPSILRVVMASGFNSKSSFNAAFKKHTGLTPSAFRQDINVLNRDAELA